MLCSFFVVCAYCYKMDCIQISHMGTHMPAPSKPPRPQYCVRKTRPLAFLEMTRMISSFHRHGRPGAEEGLPIQFLYKP